MKTKEFIRFSRDWWENGIKKIVRDFKIDDGTYTIDNVRFPRGIRNPDYVSLVVRAEKALFTILCSDYKQALRMSGLTLDEGLIDQGEGLLLPNIERYPVWIFQNNILTTVTDGSLPQKEPEEKSVRNTKPVLELA